MLSAVPATNEARYRALSDPEAEGGSWSESPWDRELEGTVALRDRPVQGANLMSRSPPFGLN